MTRFMPPQITKDYLLDTEIGKEISFIIPIDKQERIDMYYNFIEIYSPLQINDEFFIAEDITIPEDSCFQWKDVEAKYTTPEQSRFHGVVIDVRVEKVADINARNIKKDIKSFNKGYVRTLVSQHNEIHNTNIEPSIYNYVFYVTIRRLRCQTYY